MLYRDTMAKVLNTLMDSADHVVPNVTLQELDGVRMLDHRDKGRVTYSVDQSALEIISNEGFDG